MKKLILNPVLFVVVLVSFFLPFFNLSCQGQQIIEASCFELITGITPPQQNFFGKEFDSGSVTPERETEPLAAWLLGITIAGILAGFIKNQPQIIAAVLSGAGIILTYLLGNKLESDVMDNGNSMMIRVNFEIGYYLILLTLIGILLLNLYRLLSPDPKSIPDVPPYLKENLSFCEKCGSANDQDAQFCQHCGAKLMHPVV